MLLFLLAAVGCDPGGPSPAAEESGALGVPRGEVSAQEIDSALLAALAAAQAGADSVVQALRPVALMTPGQESTLRRYDNAEHLARARALGARPANAAEQDRFVEAGRLVRVPDTTDLYVLRELDASAALLTPDALALLEAVARRFQAEMEERGLPAYRVVVSSLLRTAEDQAELRRTNPNAAAGTSTHEFGTTLDITYEGWAAPAELAESYVPSEPAWLAPHAEVAARALLEHAAARKSRELTRILGDVLREMQSEGLMLVTLERRQPVYHITVARRMGGE